MANSAHCTMDLKQEMSDNVNYSSDSRPERETSFVDVKSLLDEAIFPLYRPLILNPVRETDVSVAQFRSDPDAQSPRSFRGFIERVTTFKPQTWGADPNAALYFAKHGWRGTTDCNIRCNMCLTSIDCSHVLGKGELWFILAKKGHDTLCPFQFISTPDDLFKLPTDPGIIQQNVTKIWGSLITLETELPSITEDVISDLGIENKVVDLFFKALESPVTEFGLSALVLGLCGWVKGNSRNTIECNFCQRCVGLWNFFSIADKTPSLSSQEEPVPNSSSEVPSHEKDAHSPKPPSPSVCSEHSPSQEIIPSDCEVPLDSNDYVSEECSETSDMESGDGVDEEEDEGEDFEEYDQSSTMDIPRSMSKSRSTGKRKKVFDSNSEEHSEDSDDEVASRSNLSSCASFQGRVLDRNAFSVDSSDLFERDRIIQLARKIKKQAIDRMYRIRVRYADYRARFSNENSENYLKESCTKSSLGSIDKVQQVGTSRILGQAVDTTLISGSHNDIQEVEDDDSDMECNRKNKRGIEESSLDEICNGPSREELPDNNFKLVLECPSSSEADDGSVDPLDTQGVKRTLEDVHGEDLNDSSSVKRRKVGDDTSEKEISSISQCTLVNVKDITNRLSAHGVTLAKCEPIQIGPLSEAAEPRERGTKRKANSMDEEQAETGRNTLHPRKDLANNVEVFNAEGLPCEDSNVTGELKNKINDSNVNKESDLLCKENSSAVSVKDGKEGSKSISDGISKDDDEIPVDMRNGIDSSKLSSENECEIDSATFHSEEQGKIINSNKVTLHEIAVSNGDVKEDPVEGSRKISNGDSAIVSPDSRHEEKSGSERMNGKLESESIGPCNSTTDHGNEVVEDNAKHEICIVQEETDIIDTKMDINESSQSDHAGAENHEMRVNESKGNDETSVAHSFSKSPEGGEISANPVSNNAETNSSVAEEKKIIIADENLVTMKNPVCCGVEPIENDNCKENVDIEIKMESADSESLPCTVAETDINTDKSDVAGAGNNIADTETSSAEKKSNDDVKVRDDSRGDIKSDVSTGEVQCLSSHGKEIDGSIDEKTDIVPDDKVETSQVSADVDKSPDVKEDSSIFVDSSAIVVETSQVSVDVDKSPDIKEDSSILADSSANVKDSDISVQEDGLDRNNREDNVGEKLQSLSEQKIPVSTDEAVEIELKDSECPVVDDKQDVVMEHCEEEDKNISIVISTDKTSEVGTCNTEDIKDNGEEMEVSGPPQVPLDDSCEQRAPADKDASQDCAVSRKNVDEEVVSRKRRHSSVEEEEVQGDSHKKFKSDEAVAKVDFHPIKEHRFWCIYRLNTATSNGVAKPGWAQLRDGLRLGLSMECVSYDDTVDLKDFRMRLAKHLAHW
ncbi:dentin sialophosphoprotein [Anabrus simplex]|uniref:dentin sialophosphoprotein n=1 Tax=Anabrus simplex TaxID=316456 RepID=UPI0035A29C10